MDARQLGADGPRVASIGLGCMGMSWGYATSRRDDDASAAVIARLGLSEVTVAEAAAAHAIHPVAAIQSELSLWTRDPLGTKAASAHLDADAEAAMPAAGGAGAEPEGDLLAWTEEHGAAFVPFAPLGRGYLTGTLAPGSFESNDFRAGNARFTGEAFARNSAIVDAVEQIAEAHAATSAQVALSWLLGVGDNVIPIPGTRSSTHLTQNLAAADLVLTPGERRVLDELPAAFGARY